MMKKNFNWMFAAILTSGLLVTSCDKTDSPVYTPDPQLEPTVVDFEATEAGVYPFEIYDEARIKGEVVADETTGSNAAKFTRSGSSGFGFAAYDLSQQMENATKAKISFDFMIPAEILGQSAIALGDAAVYNAATGGFNTSSGQYGNGTNGCIFYFGAYRGKAYGGGNENYFQINGKPAAASQEAHPAADVWGKWFHADIDVNVANKIVNYTIKQGNEVWFENNGDTLAFVSDAAETCTQLSVYIGNAGSYLIDNIKVEKKAYDESIVYADYAVTFVDTEGNPLPEELKAAVTRRAKVGSAITLLDSDKANLQSADGSLKYIYQSDNSEGATVTADGTVIVVVFKVEEVKKYNYIVNCYIEGGSGSADRLAQFSGEEFEGVNSYVRPAICYKHTDGFYYTIAPQKYNGYVYTITGNEEKVSAGGKDYVVGALYYAKDESIVYWGECEDLAQEGNFGTPFSQGTFDRISQCKSAQPLAGATITTDVIPAGTYDISIYGRCDGGSGDENDVLYILDKDGNLTKVAVAPNPATWASANMGWIVFSGVTIPEGAKLVIKNDSAGEKNSYDCIKVVIPAAPAE